MSVFSGLGAKEFLSSVDNVIAYAKEITSKVFKKSKMKPFIATSEDDDNAVIKGVKRESIEEGNIIGVGYDDDLVDAGARGGVSFNASSEEITELKQYVKVDSFQHKVPSNNNITLANRAKSFLKKAKNKLIDWATMRFDKVILSAFSANLTNIVACGHHTDNNTANIEKSDVITLADVSEAKRRADQGKGYDGNGKEIDMPPLKPTSMNREENGGYYEDLPSYILFLGTDSARHIKNDANYEEARKDAADRGKSNPIFTGALGYWDGVLMLNIQTDTKRQSGVLTSKSSFTPFGNVLDFDLSTYDGKADANGDKQEVEMNLLVGASAGYMVVDKGIEYFEWADKDDPRKMHAGIHRVFGFAKTKYDATLNGGMLKETVFNDKDFGVIGIASSTGR